MTTEQGPNRERTHHTPGPWEYVEEYGSRVVADGVAFSAPYRLEPGSGPCARQNADNRLIASAPALLAACRSAVNALRSYQYGNCAPDLAESIADAIARICRYTGHVPFYSVAQHCVHVSEMVPPEHALWGLLHDAHEAYVGDVSAPLKWAMTHLAKDSGKDSSPFRIIEDRAERAVLKHFGMHADEKPATVREADLRMLMTEARDLLGPPPKPWSIPHKPYDWKVIPLDPIAAELCFRARLAELHRAA